eukprot:Seg389.3 transcript_id=Seg389.3/GoldUCD/mRNA.D3Y31 product="Werner syndrome ATP-dependent helicase" protein_id=Seg389.3/GoldUCD/D3Y31
MLALTATASKELEKKIVKSLAMGSFTMIRISPNRLNIHLASMKCAKLNPSVLAWLVEKLRQENRLYEKTIIYCQSIENVSKLYVYLKEQLGPDAYDSFKEQKLASSMLIGMYHRKTSEKQKQRILDDLSEVHGSCRVVVATTSLVMGVDISDLKCVIHYGSPSEIIDYIQGIGRAGRDGTSAKAILYYSGHQLSKAMPEMKAYAKTETCLRVALYGCFDINAVKLPAQKHECCSYCHSSCACEGIGSCSLSRPDYQEIAEISQQNAVRVVTEEEKQLFSEVLMDYKLQQGQEYQNAVSFMDKEYFIGLSVSMIKEIVEHVPFICSLEHILENTPVYHISHAGEILLMLQDIFEDVSEGEQEKAKEAICTIKQTVHESTLPEWLLDIESDEDITECKVDNSLEEFFADVQEFEISDNNIDSS